MIMTLMITSNSRCHEGRKERKKERKKVLLFPLQILIYLFTSHHFTKELYVANRLYSLIKAWYIQQKNKGKLKRIMKT